MLRQILFEIERMKFLKNVDLCKIYAYAGEKDFCLSQGADEKIQLVAFMAEIMSRIKN